MKKKQKSNYGRLENLLGLAGLAVVLVGIIASLYGTYTNQRFIHDAFDALYYLRWAILLSGGFALGLLFSKRLETRNQMFNGAFFAFLTTSVFWFLDTIRVISQNLFGAMSFPGGRAIFLGSALFTLVVVGIVASILQRSKQFDYKLRLLVTVSFLITQLYFLVQTMTSLSSIASSWMAIASFFLMPIFITILAYVFFDKIKQRFDRLFYASLVGAIYSIFSVVVWDFQTDPTVEATNLFSSIVASITIAMTALILWRAQRIIK